MMYDGYICDEVGDGFLVIVCWCVEYGIELWCLWIDLGIGFAKTGRVNIELLRDLLRVWSCLVFLGGVFMNVLMFVGVFCKCFFGEILGRFEVSEWDVVFVVAFVVVVRGGADVVRVYNVVLFVDVVWVVDVLWWWYD